MYIVHKDFRTVFNVLSLITIKKKKNDRFHCARQYLTFHNIAWLQCKIVCIYVLLPFPQEIRGFISCFQLDNLHKAVNFKSLMGVFLL